MLFNEINLDDEKWRSKWIEEKGEIACNPDGNCSPYNNPCDPSYDPVKGCSPDNLTDCPPEECSPDDVCSPDYSCSPDD